MSRSKNAAAVALGSLGGKARAHKLSRKRRVEIAKTAVAAREAKKLKGTGANGRRTKIPSRASK